MKNQLVQAFRLSSFLHPRGFAGHAILTPYSYEFPSSMSKPFPPHQVAAVERRFYHSALAGNEALQRLPKEGLQSLQLSPSSQRGSLP